MCQPLIFRHLRSQHGNVILLLLRSHTRDDLTIDAAYDINRNAPFLSVGKRQNATTAFKVGDVPSAYVPVLLVSWTL